jgi:pimeloyl-ACP methyl ester carboxylesterase
MLDYPGYGKSKGGLPSEDGLRDSAAAVYDAAVAEERGDEKRVVVFGRSIGTGLAVRLAATRNPGRLILESPYDSLVSLARTLFPWAPGFLVRYPLRSDLDAPKVRCPTLILHGTEDEVIPFEQGRRLAARIPGAIFVPIRGGHHNDLDSFEAWRNALRLFLKTD